MSDPQKISSILWEITCKCNLKCSHCKMWSNPSNNNHTDEIYYALNEIISVSPISVGIMGGEPLLIPIIDDIIKKLSQNKISTGLITNGILLNSKRADKLKETGLNEIAISVDGTQTIHNKIRNSQISFASAINGIINSYNSEIPLIKVISSIHKANISSIDSLKDILLSLKIPITWQLNTASVEIENMISHNEYQLLKTYIKNNQYDNLRIISSHEMCGFEKNSSCPAGKDRAGIRSNGDVFPCLSMISTHNPIGNIFETPLLLLFNNLKNKDPIKGFFYNCKSCDKFSNCPGTCPEFASYQNKIKNLNKYCPYE